MNLGALTRVENFGRLATTLENLYPFLGGSEKQKAEFGAVKKYCFRIQDFYLILPYNCIFFTIKQDDLLAARSDASRIV
ncbi:hypothetical protein E5S67_01384 [Microcoleus sp. IPMA8]|uniref:Uncharacterized protein n=1 Tax=Microcoleus asticus IPMA8 TaxID=2563858 RepID=A0ABX2CTJ5_9CYAN|nr:hypothetical protein [Microcoleus asticus IPMA8]